MRFLKSFIKFSLDRISHLVLNSGHSENIVVSPPAIYEMLVTIARETSKERRLDLLVFLNARYNEYTRFIKRYDTILVEYEKVFRINNLLYYRGKINSDFVSKFDFGGFINDELIKSLVKNKVKRKLNKEITFITDRMAKYETKRIQEDFSVSLLKTIHFNSDWSKKFDRRETTKRVFNDKNIYMMRQTSNFKASILRNDYKAVILPYEGTNHFFVAVMPSNNSNLESLQYYFMRNQSLDKLIQECTETCIDLSMPMFSIETDIDLSDNLDKLGLDSLLRKTKFNGIMEDLEIDKIRMRQKIILNFNENGTYSNKVRNLENYTTNFIPDSDTEELVFDKPFLFYIVETVIDDRIRNYVPLIIGSYIGDSQ